MKTRLSLTLLALCLCASPPALAVENDYYAILNQMENKKDEDTPPPLLSITFRSDSINYQSRVLYAVDRTLLDTPGAHFYLVSAIPTTGFYKDDMQNTKNAAENVEKIVSLLEEAGLPRTRVHTSYKDTDKPDNTIYLYASVPEF